MSELVNRKAISLDPLRSLNQDTSKSQMRHRMSPHHIILDPGSVDLPPASAPTNLPDSAVQSVIFRDMLQAVSANLL